MPFTSKTFATIRLWRAGPIPVMRGGFAVTMTVFGRALPMTTVTVALVPVAALVPPVPTMAVGLGLAAGGARVRRLPR